MSGADTTIRLRRDFRAKRDAMPRAACEALSRRITERLACLLDGAPTSTVALYAAIGNEVDVLGLLTSRTKHTYCLPVVASDDRLVFRRVALSTPLRPGRFGIREPAAAHAPEVTLTDIATVIVPLVVFDASCQRIGMGGGYYDRTFAIDALPADRRPHLIGAAYELQRTTSIAARPWDVRLDCVVTESVVHVARDKHSV